MQEDIDFARLSMKPGQVVSSAVILSTIILALSVILNILFSFPLFLGLLTAAFLFYYIYSYPSFMKNVVKTQAQGESIKIILLLSVYLRYIPNLEHAFAFVARYSSGPISRDIRKVIWDVESGKFSTIGEAIQQYSKRWIKWDPDFVRSLNMLMNSLEKLDEKEREKGIEDALRNIIEATHMKMRLYTEVLGPKITLIHAGGVLMPVMGLIMFPVMSIFLSDSFNPWYVAFGYTVLLPFFLYWFSSRTLAMRPGSYSAPDISLHPDNPPKGHFYLDLEGERFSIPVAPIAIILGLLVMLPGIFHFINFSSKLLMTHSYKEKVKLLYDESEVFTVRCMQYWLANHGWEGRDAESGRRCKVGLHNLFYTFSITLGLGIAAFVYFYLKSFQRIKIRNMVKELEDEFGVGMFMIANHLSNGAPIEVAIEKSIREYENLGIKSTCMLEFLKRIDSLMRDYRYTFDMATSENSGLLRQYPSILIREMLKILRESVRKSPIIASAITKSIIKYTENIKDVEIKIRQSLEDVRSSLRMQATIITPIITGSVSALSIFLVHILRLLGEKLDQITKMIDISGGIGQTLMGQSAGQSFLSMIMGDFTKLVPYTILQVIIGVYLVEILIIMGYLLNGIENGFDEASQDYIISNNLLYGITIYFLVSIISIIAFGGLIPKDIGV